MKPVISGIDARNAGSYIAAREGTHDRNNKKGEARAEDRISPVPEVPSNPKGDAGQYVQQVVRWIQGNVDRIQIGIGEKL